MKAIYCEGCKIRLGNLATGSQIRKGIVFLCSTCETKRKMSDLANKTKPKNSFNDLFGGML